ncbi:MAG: diaminopimelate decarboxylase [Deltaproteobacteria bacterium]|nr:diaminopimelate decarboxylase [Deltaproteobacteria bacterium]
MRGPCGEIAFVPVAEIARDFGTPTYVYDAAAIVERIAELSRFDVLRYAQKANSNLAVLDLCRRHGALVDAVSAGEIHRALAAGFDAQGDPPPIVYTADVFDRESLDCVIEHGIAVNCGSPDMIDQYGESTGGGGEITLRINPGFGHGHNRKTNTGGAHSKHGVWHEDLPGCLARARRHGLRITGAHMHIGSGADLEHLAQVAGALERLAPQLGGDLHTLSAGGGLPVSYRAGEPASTPETLASYFRLWDAARRRLEARLGRALRLEIEPGRYLVAEAGTLVTEVRAVKRQGGNHFVLVDAGFNTLARPAMYGAYHPMSLLPKNNRAAGAGPEERKICEVVVGGPLCESGDIFTQDEEGMVRTQPLPEAQVGDLLLIGCAGAYGFSMSSNYNSKPRAAEVMISGGRAHLIRARETGADLMRGERIP